MSVFRLRFHLMLGLWVKMYLQGNNSVGKAELRTQGGKGQDISVLMYVIHKNNKRERKRKRGLSIKAKALFGVMN